MKRSHIDLIFSLRIEDRDGREGIYKENLEKYERFRRLMNDKLKTEKSRYDYFCLKDRNNKK